MSTLDQVSEQASTAKKPATKAAKPAKAAKRKPGEPRGAKVEKVTTDARQTVQRPAPKPPAKAKAPAASAKKAAGEWGVQVGSNQERLLQCLKKCAGKPVAMDELLRAVYGPKEAKSKSGAIAMVIGGVRTKVRANNHDLVRGRHETGPTIMLVKKGR